MSAGDALRDLSLAVGLGGEVALSSADLTDRELVAFLTEAGGDVARRAEWSTLTRTATVPAGTQAWPVPDDFDRLCSAGAIRTAAGPVRVVPGVEMWEFVRAFPPTRSLCHLRGSQVLFAPALAAPATVPYQSREWAGPGKVEPTADNDVLAVPEDLVVLGGAWRWRRAKGLAYDDLVAEFEALLAERLRADRGAA